MTAVRTALSRGPCPSFPRLAARYLEEYLEKIRRAVEPLDFDQVWWRPAPDSNSIGNLLLHLAGNLSLWLRKGLGGDDFTRDRAAEFAADRTHGSQEMLEQLAGVVGRCREILETLDGQALDRMVEVQTYPTDALGVVFHAVEHMSYHTGQILTLTKLQRGAGHGIEFYPQHRGE
jgi:uncharacterized damage-inducible protein DinB